MKHLGQFFKILTGLWVHEDFVENFETYISQLNGLIVNLLSQDEQAIAKNYAEVKREYMKLFFILKGIVHGLNTQKYFALFFDWFYPEYFPIIGRGLTAFIHDDEVVLVIFKFLAELVNNRCSRLRFDTWNINGLVVFKEAAKISIQYLQWTECLTTKAGKSGDIYKDKFKFLDSFMNIFINCITGHFINFAICEFYSDDTFSQLSQFIFKAIVSQEYENLRVYEKLHKKAFSLTESFFRNHLELLFFKFDFQLIQQILALVNSGLADANFEINQSSCTSLDYFNEYLYQSMKRPRKKQPQLAANVSAFYQQCAGWVFTTFLQTLTFGLFFEDHKNIWVYQKCFHSSIVMADLQTAPKVMYDVIVKEEKSEQRRQAMLAEVEKLFTNLAPNLDAKSRDVFNSKFTTLKTFLFDMNATA